MAEGRTIVAMIGNPVSDKGKGAKIDEQVSSLLDEAGRRYGFDVIDLTGASFDDSLGNARNHRKEYRHLVVVGGDGMIALGANAVGDSDVSLGVVATGSGNDFARGLGLPVNRVETAVEGIVGAIVRGSHIDVDLGRVSSLPGGYAVDAISGDLLSGDPRQDAGADIGTLMTGAHASAGGAVPNGGTADTADGAVAASGAVSDIGGRIAGGDGAGAGGALAGGPVLDENPALPPIDRYYGGMLSCGLDASINDRANHSHLPGGSLRYLAAVLIELTHMKRYGYHVKATLSDYSVEERDIISPMLTVANSRHIGGGLEVSPYSRFSDGLLDLVWMDHTPNPAECVDAISKVYSGRLLASKVFGWKRVREVEITRAGDGAEPPVLMADGEYIGHQPVKVTAQRQALRVLVPPAVAEAHSDESDRASVDAIRRDGRDPVTGEFV